MADAVKFQIPKLRTPRRSQGSLASLLSASNRREHELMAGV